MFVDLHRIYFLLSIEGIIHNMIDTKIIIRKFFKYFCRKYRWRKKYWQYFDVLKDFHLIKNEIKK